MPIAPTLKLSNVVPSLLTCETRGTIYIGIDPGASGGLAFIWGTTVWTVPMPDSDAGILDGLNSRELVTHPTYCCMEQVGGYVGDGGQPGSRMFNFGAGYGALRMALTSLKIPFELVPPQRWQKALNIPSRKKAAGEKQPQFKKRLRILAQQRFPDISVTGKVADALLIALYCKRKQEGTL